MSRPLLYVCAPVRTATDEERALVRAVRLIAFDLGWVPVWGPALLGGLGLTEEVEREQLLDCDVSALLRCDALALVGTRVTEGMELELRAWLERDRAVYLAHQLPPGVPGWSARDYWIRSRWLPLLGTSAARVDGERVYGPSAVEVALAGVRRKLAAIGGVSCSS